MKNDAPRTHIFWREDIRSVLAALDGANLALTSNLPLREVGIYRAGFAAAIQAMASAFDVQLDAPAQQQRNVKLLPDNMTR